LQRRVTRAEGNDSNKNEPRQIRRGKDDLITSYGSFLLSSKGLTKGSQISHRMRLLGQLLKVLASKFEIKKMLNFIDPKCLDDVVDVTKELGEYSLTLIGGERRPVFSKPSLPLKMGYAIVQSVN